jgi:hypothetical protein
LPLFARAGKGKLYDVDEVPVNTNRQINIGRRFATDFIDFLPFAHSGPLDCCESRNDWDHRKKITAPAPSTTGP